MGSTTDALSLDIKNFDDALRANDPNNQISASLGLLADGSAVAAIGLAVAGLFTEKTPIIAKTLEGTAAVLGTVSLAASVGKLTYDFSGTVSDTINSYITKIVQNINGATTQISNAISNGDNSTLNNVDANNFDTQISNSTIQNLLSNSGGWGFENDPSQLNFLKPSNGSTFGIDFGNDGDTKFNITTPISSISPASGQPPTDPNLPSATTQTITIIVTNTYQLASKAVVYKDAAGNTDTKVYSPDNDIVTQETAQNAATDVVMQSYYDAKTGIWISTGTYQNGQLIKLDIAPNVAFDQFVGAEANAFAGQVIAQFVFEHNLPASILAQAFTKAGIDAVTNAVTGPVAGNPSFSADFATSLTSLAGGILGSKEGAALAQSLNLPTEVGSFVGNVAGEITAQQLTDYIITRAFGPIEGVGPSLLSGESPAQFLSSAGDVVESAGAGALGTILGEQVTKLLIGNGTANSAIGSAFGSAAFAVAGSSLAVLSSLGLT